MAATVRYDEQYCPVARALDALGDRWTLLILRELLIDDQRFTDLRNHLPGIAPTLLTHRLNTMIEQGLVTTKKLPPPAARSVYTATERGRSVAPIMRALAKWGLPLLGEPDDDQVIRPWSVINASVGTAFDAAAAEGIDERYLFRVDGQEMTLSSVPGGGVAHDQPDLVVESGARVWIDIRQGRLTLAQAIDRGLVVTTGPRSALRNLQKIFAIT
jgi:DNA-binding HxlR family transcriptional regulator